MMRTGLTGKRTPLVVFVGLSAMLTFGETVRPELLFRATFDGTTDALVAKGAAKPLEAKNLEYAEGVSGQAVRFRMSANGVLAYAEDGNLCPDRGSVSFWAKSERQGPFPTISVLFSNPRPQNRIGTGALMLWAFDGVLRTDVSDDKDRHVDCGGMSALDGRWHHFAWNWSGRGTQLYIDGRPFGVGLGDGGSPIRTALAAADGQGIYKFSRRIAFDKFFIGSRGNDEGWVGLIDDFRVYSAPLATNEIAALAREFGAPERCPFDYAAFFGRPRKNPYVGAPAAVPGTIPDDDLELVDEVRIETKSDVERLRATNRFSSVGDLFFGSLEGRGYVSTGSSAGDRLAVRFPDIDVETTPICVFDIDYPDDAKRTMEVLIQTAKGNPFDYSMQCGLLTGGEYPLTRRILTHRVVRWNSSGESAVILTTARDRAPAAIHAIRVYRVKSGTLPPAPVREPKANGDGWRRMLSLYYEDPSIGYEFAVDGRCTTPQSLGETIDRTIATMRFTGENLFAYPGAFYHGLIGERYNNRAHADDFLSAWYEKFDREGDLYVVPTLNVNNMPVPDGLVTVASMDDGSLHNSPLAIHNTGRPNPGKWHGSPPNFNIAHPDVQAYLDGIVDDLLSQGASHPSFKGIALHAAWHGLLSFGNAESGYNDYCIDAFEKATGVRVPCDRNDPMRGKKYGEWLRVNAWEKWIDWRCDVISRYWCGVARRMRARRPDLKLWINLFTLSSPNHPDWGRSGYARQVALEMGFDRDKLTASAPNLILSQCVYPADARWRGEEKFKGNSAGWRYQCEYPELGETYDFLKNAEFPWVGQHDRYWESAMGRSKSRRTGKAQNTLSCDWLKECPWRVAMLNPPDVNALRHFVLPFRYGDVLGLSKGGFLVGTYGMEKYLAKFAAEFRSLPAVRMEEFFRQGKVVARKAAFDGKVYGYVVNTDVQHTKVVVPGVGEYDLGPYEFRAFCQ